MPKNLTEGAVAVASLNPDPDHDIDLEKGKFKRTSPAELTQAFSKFASSGSHHICVFFHGGLVPRSDGVKLARELTKPYTDSGAYPFFFIWNSGLLTTIRDWLGPYQHEPTFVAAANRIVAQGANKIAAVLDLNATLKGAAKARSRLAPIDLESLAKFAEPYDKAWTRNRGAQLPVSPDELADFERWLVKLKPDTKRRTLFTTTRIRGLRKALRRVIERLNSGHGHGLYTTVIEELVIAAGLADKVGAPIWNRMKLDIDAAFTKDADAGGTAFLQNLGDAWKRDPNLKVTLIAHSAGAIYQLKFIEAFDDFFGSEPARKVEVLTLASAVSFERMNQGLAVLERRTSGLRMFGLSDKREGGYWEVPGIYDKSLLYIVCSLCEKDPEADRPFVGMQRYWSGTRPYDQPYINAVTGFVESSTKPRTVWAPSAGSAACGYQSDADRHGCFPIEKKTMASICCALKNGL